MENKPPFQPDPSCRFIDQCLRLGICAEAMAIKSEILYERDHGGESDLKKRITLSSCGHQQAVDARSEGNKLLAQQQ